MGLAGSGAAFSSFAACDLMRLIKQLHNSNDPAALSARSNASFCSAVREKLIVMYPTWIGQECVIKCCMLCIRTGKNNFFGWPASRLPLGGLFVPFALRLRMSNFSYHVPSLFSCNRQSKSWLFRVPLPITITFSSTRQQQLLLAGVQVGRERAESSDLTFINK